MIRQTQAGHWIIDGDTHLGKWAEESGSLVVDHAVPLIVKHIQPGATVIDVGAYIGDHTVAYLDAVGPFGKVVAFEPNREAYDCLVRNCPAAIAFNFGLSHKTHTGHITVKQNYGASHIAPGQGSVVLAALDDMHFGRVGLIKIDAEGFEPMILTGAAKTILRDKPVILCEINDPVLARLGFTRDSIFSLMVSYGYRHENIYGGPIDPTEPQVDIIFFPQ